MKIGIISGHSIPRIFKNATTVHVDTPYGTIPIEVARMYNHDIFFVNRHGEQSNIPPHKVNYRGNIQSLAASHVESILAIGTVGSMKRTIKPGDMIIPHDVIDFTKSRSYTFFDDHRVYIDMTQAYCPNLRDQLITQAQKIRTHTIHEKGIYLATEGPRLETVAEIQYYSQFADIVGMTAIPEITLAREKGICYASLCMVCNMAAGLQGELSADEIARLYAKQEPTITTILRDTIQSLNDVRICHCKEVVSRATL